MTDWKKKKDKLQKLVDKIPSTVGKAKKTRVLSGEQPKKPNDDAMRKILKEIKSLQVDHPKIKATEDHLSHISSWKEKV